MEMANVFKQAPDCGCKDCWYAINSAKTIEEYGMNNPSTKPATNSELVDMLAEKEVLCKELFEVIKDIEIDLAGAVCDCGFPLEETDAYDTCKEAISKFWEEVG